MGRERSRTRRLLTIGIGVAAGYGLLAYVVVPRLWRHYEHEPGLAHSPKLTTTSAGIPGDPLNVALVGREEQVLAAFAAAGWKQPARIDLRSSAGIAESVLLDRPDPNAPVSDLFLFGRKQDLAFEQEVGQSARERNHVRFWRSEQSSDGRPVWVGSATFDRGAGIDHLTGELTHHIGPDIDAERDHVLAALAAAHQLTKHFQVTGIGPTLSGHNGGGDWYYSDGEMDVGVLIAPASPAADAPEQLVNPPAIRLKNAIFVRLRPWLDRAGGAGPTP